MRLTIILAALLGLEVAAADVVRTGDRVDSYVNIRSTPDPAAEVVGRLHKSRPRPFVGARDGWNEVELDDGTTGFVSGDWSVVVAGEDESATEADARATAATDGTESGTGRDTETGSTVADADTTASVPASDAVAETAANDHRADEEPLADNTRTTARQQSDAPGAAPGPAGPPGPPGPPGPKGDPGDGAIKGTQNYLVRFKKPTVGGNSQIYDDGNRVGIGTTEPVQRLEVNGSVQIHDRTSGVAGLMIRQIEGETGYILHNAASTLTIGAGSIDRITIDRDGNIGFGVNRPEHPLELPSGAHITAGGVWTNASSRELKEDISALDLEEALAALAALEPVEYTYTSDRNEQHVGFIAEDVPDLVATSDRKGLSPMDIVAVLTRVVQAQEARIRELEVRLDEADASSR